MKVLVINAGSSSLKYQLIHMPDARVLATGVVERIGEKAGVVSCKVFSGASSETFRREAPIKDHARALHAAVELMTDPAAGILQDKKEIDAIGHRVVQGGESFKSARVISPEVKDHIRRNTPLAPLHNPPNLMGIEVAESLFPGTPNVAVFDTEFHQSMPARAFMYALPYDFYEKYRVRRYGFHGTSHKFVAAEAARLMEKIPDRINVITVHLGNGCSISAVEKGRCVDTSMGMTPLAGVMMGTRTGDMDPAIQRYLMKNTHMDVDELDRIFNKESGLKGICGKNDMRDIHQAVHIGDERARLALEMFTYQVKKYIGAYTAAMGRVDAVVFTAGIGENDDEVRRLILENMEGLGILPDMELNRGRISRPRAIHAPESRVAVWVIPTNEELQIAEEVVQTLSGD